MTELPQAPWQHLSVDFCGPLPSGDMLFVVIDEYSRYPEVEIVSSTSANTVIPKLDRILSTHGIPREIKSDNGPPFQGHSFAQFAQYMGFHHRKITPEWPKANSEAERFMRTIQKTLRAAHLENKNWKQTTVRRHIPPQEFPLPSSSLDEN
jgi:transposase InsO family protein